MRRIDSIIIHCSATPAGKVFTADDIRRWHLARGFSDIGYHYIILLDGTVQTGRPVELAGAHCTGHNANSIGICYVGGLSSDGRKPQDKRTQAQSDMLLLLARQLMDRYGIPASRVYGHREFAAKACPSFDVQQWKKEVQL